MARLVHVHGVATRSGPALDAAERNIQALLATTVFDGVPFAFIAPRWGDFVPPIRAAVFATDAKVESFSVLPPPPSDDEGGLGAAGDGNHSGPTIGEVARARPVMAVDAVLSSLVEEATIGERALTPEELSLFARAVELLGKPSETERVAEAAGSDELLEAALSPDDESYGVTLGPLREAIGRVTDRIRNLTSSFAYGLVRNSVRPAVGLFSGDVFAYLNDGELRGKIQRVVREAVASSFRDRGASEPFVLVGHSMGGVILTDMLADPATAGLPADLEVDCLLTVGSQPGLFQSVGALAGGAPAGDAQLRKPPCVQHWFNVFDPIDPLAFAAAPVFEGVEDLEFDSVTGVASAHTTYFSRPQFYARFRDRLSALGLVR